MGKSRRDGRGNTREQQLLHENNKLKRQLVQIRKQLARIDIDRYHHVKEIIQQHYQEDRAKEGVDILEKLRESWRCRKCNAGYLEIFRYNKIGKPWYYRQCNNCPHRTVAQAYTPGVKGIIKNEKD